MNLDNYPTKCEKRNVNADTRITRTLNDDNFIPELGNPIGPNLHSTMMQKRYETKLQLK